MQFPQEDSDAEGFATVQEGPFWQLFEELNQPTLVIDPDEHSVVVGNEAARELFGYSREAMQGLPVKDFRPDSSEDRESGDRSLCELLGGNKPRSVEKRLQDSDGQVFKADLELQLLQIGNQQYVHLSVAEHDEAFERKHDWKTFKTAVENAGHAIYWTDVDGSIEYANPAFEEITGFDREEVLGQTPRIFSSGAMSEAYYRNLWSTILSGETFEEEVINKSADGDRLVLSQTVTPITGPSGEIERFVAVNTDITERKERMEKLEAEKEQVKRLQQHLSVMNRVLRHDIRSAVNIIRGNAKLASEAKTKLDRALDTILDEADRLQRIGESVRHVQGVLEEKDDHENVLDLSTQIQAKVLGLQNEYPSVDFYVDLPDSVFVNAREKFDLALDHLLRNAVEHNDRDEPSVEVTVRESETGSVEILIADDGPGIPESELRPLETGRETALEHTSGLGLWLSQWIVKVSDGTLSFEANDPRGTIVRIELEAAS